MEELSDYSVLIVDDVEANVDMLVDALGEIYDVSVAMDGHGALEVVAENPPDLILLDVMMPDMDGYEVCDRIRTDTTLSYIPIIFVTAQHKDPKDMIRGLDIGGDDYIGKPFDPYVLLSRVRSSLRFKELFDTLSQTKSELSRYVSLSTIEMVEKSISGEIQKSGEARDVTVLFSDIRGFTTLSESMDPKKVFKMLNLYLSKQIKVIERYNGIIDKLAGDEVMAIFEGPDMAKNALNCGRAIIDALFESNKHIDDDWVGVGIGINTGPVYLGSIGSETIKDFTVVGNTVNVAARLCGSAKKFQVIFSEFTRSFIENEDFEYKSAGKISLKGISEQVEVFELLQNILE